ncbi:hypothetical protein L7F22_061466 [Adiantum nelumboides]|nr:hypothetical protein [Adiantum nelumboides]
MQELLREFEEKYANLSTIEQQSIRPEQVELFVQATDARLQKNLVQLLENTIGELYLTLDWKLVLDAINMIVKRQMWVDKLIVADLSKTSEDEFKDKPPTTKDRLEESVLMEIIVKLGDIKEPMLALADHGSKKLILRQRACTKRESGQLMWTMVGIFELLTCF